MCRPLTSGRRTLTAILVLTALVTLSFPGIAAAQTFQARVVGVSAGDIITFQRAGKPRLGVLYGIEAPSTSSLVGKNARRFLAERTLDKEVTIQIVERREGLTLLKLELRNGVDIAKLMLRDGLVRWDSLSAAEDAEMRQLEGLARTGRRGIWANPSEEAVRPEPVAPLPPRTIAELQRSRTSIPASDYQVLESRVDTNTEGVKTLLMRGNGQKLVGFEASIERRRMDDYVAYLEELDRQEAERFRREQEAQRRATEALRQDELDALEEELEWLAVENRVLSERLDRR